jgi:intein-encoded DNA endonuclease-like protein
MAQSITVNKESVLILTNEDLFLEHKDVTAENVEYDMVKDQTAFLIHGWVQFFDKTGKMRILKNKRGFYSYDHYTSM